MDKESFKFHSGIFTFFSLINNSKVVPDFDLATCSATSAPPIPSVLPDQKTASLKDVKILIANLSKNSKNQYHLLRYQVYSPKKLNYQTTSGVILIADSNRVTTILGRYVDDTGAIISELKLPKLMKFDIKNGKFNLLNVKDGLYKTPEQFWQQYNKPWLDKVIARDDIILLATKPEPKYLYIMDEAKTVKELTGFGREYHYLLEHGYKFDKATMQMIKGQ